MQRSEEAGGPTVLAQYQMKSGKLVKFKDTKLEAVQYTQSGSRGKLLVSFAYENPGQALI